MDLVNYIGVLSLGVSEMFFFGLKEVRSKISILLETTGGISFSPEGFKKSLFSIWNFPHGDLQSTEGFRYLSRGFIIPRKGFNYPS